MIMSQLTPLVSRRTTARSFLMDTRFERVDSASLMSSVRVPGAQEREATASSSAKSLVGQCALEKKAILLYATSRPITSR